MTTAALRCPTCNKRATEIKNSKIVLEWQKSGFKACPPCRRILTAPTAPPAPKPRCAGCGSSGSLKGDRCPKCIANGVELISLFDEATS